MPALELAIPPAADPVGIMEAKAHCRIDESIDDSLLAGYILAARRFCEKETGRVFMSQTWDMKLDRGWPSVWDQSCSSYRRRIVLPKPPASSVASIKYVDATGVEQTLAADQYQFSKGEIFGFIEPAYGASWPAVRSQLNAITVRFAAGYGSNPGDVEAPLRHAILLMTGHFYENREAVSAGGNVTEMPLAVCALLESYKTEGWV